MTIGLLGGTFDPVHYGHLRPALEVQQALNLEQICFIPCGLPPHREPPVASVEQRIAMLKLAVQQQPGFALDLREVERPGPSYMIDTVRSYHETPGQNSYCLLLGMDAFMYFDTWKDWQSIIEHVNLIIMTRPGADLQSIRGKKVLQGFIDSHVVADKSELSSKHSGGLLFQEVTSLAISATAIREAVKRGNSVKFLMPDAVIDYINKYELYR
jgi:nicotinate-nucleotide adenylyltransferase